jgi:hypothetical protein
MRKIVGIVLRRMGECFANVVGTSIGPRANTWSNYEQTCLTDSGTPDLEKISFVELSRAKYDRCSRQVQPLGSGLRSMAVATWLPTFGYHYDILGFSNVRAGNVKSVEHVRLALGGRMALRIRWWEVEE